jgi:hypothetical protein
MGGWIEDGSIILKLILEKWSGMLWTEIIWFRKRAGGRLL